MNKWMVHLYLGLVFGAVIYFTYSYMGMIPAIVILLPYLVILKRDYKGYLTFIIIGLSLVAFINCYTYFYGIKSMNTIECRVEEARTGYYIGSYNNRKLKIFTNHNIDLGKKYILKGDFTPNVDYTKGIIGDFTVNAEEPLSEDLIYKGYKLKNELYNLLVKATDEEGAAIVLAVSCGDSSYIDYDKREEFNILGISHIISVSGLHVTLIYNMLSGIIGYKLSLLVLLFYVIFTGGESSTIRAFIMILLLVLGPKLRKKYDGISALAFAAFFLLLLKPYYILDIGYVLSFLAVLGIYMLNKKIRRWLYKLPDFIGSSVSLSISSMIFTTPYIIMTFNYVSLGGFISNLLLIPFYNFLVVLGNLLLIFIKIPFIFNLLSMMTNSVLFIINSIEGILVKILPAPIAFTYIEGIMILILYLAYILIKKGVKSLKYLPVLLMILVVKEQYIIYPEINFIAGKKFDVIQVCYGNKNIMISPEKVKLKYVYEEYGDIDRIYDEFDKDLNLKLSKNYSMDVHKDKGNLTIDLKYKDEIKKLFIDEEFEAEGIMVIQCCSEQNPNLFSKTYDIIKINRKRSDIKIGCCYESYKMINGEIYHNYLH